MVGSVDGSYFVYNYIVAKCVMKHQIPLLDFDETNPTLLIVLLTVLLGFCFLGIARGRRTWLFMGLLMGLLKEWGVNPM